MRVRSRILRRRLTKTRIAAPTRSRAAQKPTAGPVIITVRWEIPLCCGVTGVEVCPDSSAVELEAGPGEVGAVYWVVPLVTEVSLERGALVVPLVKEVSLALGALVVVFSGGTGSTMMDTVFGVKQKPPTERTPQTLSWLHGSLQCSLLQKTTFAVAPRQLVPGAARHTGPPV